MIKWMKRMFNKLTVSFANSHNVAHTKMYGRSWIDNLVIKYTLPTMRTVAVTANKKIKAFWKRALLAAKYITMKTSIKTDAIDCDVDIPNIFYILVFYYYLSTILFIQFYHFYTIYVGLIFIFLFAYFSRARDIIVSA